MSGPRLCILVGAGATLAEALPARPTKAQTPPLDATFFDLCRRAGFGQGKTVARYMKSLYGIDPFDGAYGMEEIFNLIYADAHSRDPSDECLSAYWALLRLYQTALRFTTNGLTGKTRAGVGGLLRRVLRAWPQAHLSFVTFNQDLVIEKALQAAFETKSYEHIGWNLQFAYEMDFQGETEIGLSGSFYSGPVAWSEPIKVLKLHGSMNWVYTVRSASDARNALRRPGGRLFRVNEARIFASLSLSGTKSQDVLPLVVPPVYEKTGHLSDRLHSVWQAARESIRKADRLIVFGYSFPNADIAARSLVQQSYHRSETLEHIDVIDVNAGVVPKVARILGAPAIRWHRSVQEFSRQL